MQIFGHFEVVTLISPKTVCHAENRIRLDLNHLLTKVGDKIIVNIIHNKYSAESIIQDNECHMIWDNHFFLRNLSHHFSSPLLLKHSCISENLWGCPNCGRNLCCCSNSPGESWSGGLNQHCPRTSWDFLSSGRNLQVEITLELVGANSKEH